MPYILHNLLCFINDGSTESYSAFSDLFPDIYVGGSRAIDLYVLPENPFVGPGGGGVLSRQRARDELPKGRSRDHRDVAFSSVYHAHGLFDNRASFFAQRLEPAFKDLCDFFLFRLYRVGCGKTVVGALCWRGMGRIGAGQFGAVGPDNATVHCRADLRDVVSAGAAARGAACFLRGADSRRTCACQLATALGYHSFC